MKTIKYLSLFILLLFGGCQGEEIGNPTFGDKDVPRIFMAWQEEINTKVGNTLVFSPRISPSDGEISYRWTLNETVLTTDKELTFTPTQAMEDVELRFEVVRNGVMNYRVGTITVSD